MMRIVILVLALLSAGAAAFLVRNMMGSSRETQAAAPANIQNEEILVAAVNIALGERLTSTSVSWQPWPKTALSPSYFTRIGKPEAIKDVEGAVARAEIAAGEPIIESKLARTGESGFMAALLSPGMRAVSVSISPETGAGGFILPNDYVDVIVAREQEVNDGYNTTRAVVSETLFSKVRVLAIDQTFREKDGEQVVVGKTATIELKPGQAERLARAQQNGQISLALRPLADNGATETAAMPEESEESDNSAPSTITVYRYGAPSLVNQSGTRR
jgi:pilus assembly protein CpaB